MKKIVKLFKDTAIIAVVIFSILVVLEISTRLFYSDYLGPAYSYHPEYGIVLKSNLTKTLVHQAENGGVMLQWRTNAQGVSWAFITGIA